ncbi:hypothetical protein EMCRGX_G006567 [Ephydatia muelleri]
MFVYSESDLPISERSRAPRCHFHRIAGHERSEGAPCAVLRPVPLDLLEGSGDQTATPRTWQQLRHQNLLLAQQLQEREVERNRLREQLEIHLQRQERLQKFSPPGLPSRVLDGRPVIRKETQSAGGGSSGGREPHWDKAGSPGPRGADEVLVASLQSQIDQLSQEKEAIQHSLEGDKMTLQAEVERQREAITKLKERKDDLTQNVAVLDF